MTRWWMRDVQHACHVTLKETYILSKEPYILKRALYSVERALSTLKRALYSYSLLMNARSRYSVYININWHMNDSFNDLFMCERLSINESWLIQWLIHVSINESWLIQVSIDVNVCKIGRLLHIHQHTLTYIIDPCDKLHTHQHTSTYVYIYAYILVYSCVCEFVYAHV